MSMSHCYNVTDVIGTSGTTTVNTLDQVVPAIRGWFPEPTDEITEALEELDRQLTSHSQGGGWREVAEFLGIDVEEDSYGE